MNRSLQLVTVAEPSTDAPGVTRIDVHAIVLPAMKTATMRGYVIRSLLST